jgi:class 3 adenylate cyclase/tetratricopeptide (TPR) repeat protein
MAEVLCPVLVGRDRELHVLTTALEEARTSRGTAVFVLGEAGMGKSRLVAELAGAAREHGCTVALGRAVEGHGQAPFRALTEALFSTFRHTGPPELAEIAPFRAALGRVVPEWSQAPVHSETSLVVLSEGVLRLLRALARREALLLILEDLQWADPETLAVVQYLADNLGAERLLLIGTVRLDEASAGLTLARSSSARRTARVVELAGLGDFHAEVMVRACLQAQFLPEGLGNLVRSRAEGVPFLVEELLSAAVSSGALFRRGAEWALASEVDVAVPLTFADTVRRRLSTLGQEAQDVLRGAAILGHRFPWKLLGSITGLEAERVLDALDRAVGAQLVVTKGETRSERTFGFRHAITRDAVLGELLPYERARLARTALEALEAVHPGLPGEWCELAAQLSEEAGEVARASALLLEMGRRALARGALATGMAALERARARAPDDPALQFDIDEVRVEVLSLAGQTDQAFEIGEDLLTALEQRPGTASRRARIHLGLARAAVGASRWPRARRHIERGRLLVDQEEKPALLPLIDALAAQAAMGESRLDEAVAHAEAALEAAERAGLPEAACEALEVLGRRARLHDLDQAAAAFERARGIAEEHGLRLWEIRALHELGTVEMLRGGRVTRFLEARELAYQAGALSTAATIDLQLAGLLAMRFEPERAIEHASRCIDAARRFRFGLLLAMGLAYLAAAHAVAGRRGEMEAALEEAVALAGEHPDVQTVAWGKCRGLLSLLEEDRSRALAEFDMAMEAARSSPLTPPDPFRGLWALLRTLEYPAEAAAREEIRASGVAGSGVISALLGYAEAVALGRRDRHVEAEQAFEAAEAEMGRFEGVEAIRQLARRLVAEEAIRDGWGAPARWLREAIAFFEGAHDHVASACRRLLRKAGEPVPRRGRGETKVPPPLRSIGITSRELDVLALVAEELGNAEIAARLYLSPRTVEKHVERLRQKTGTAGRSELADFAVRTGIVPAGAGGGQERARVATAGRRPSSAGRERKTFMFTDIVRSTNLVEAIGDEAWSHLLRWHDQSLRSLFASHNGEEVNRIGDGFFVAFDRPETAIECAIAIQRLLSHHRREQGFSPEVRIGLHETEATRTGDDYEGRGVHEAARIAALAAGSEILASSSVIAGTRRFKASEARSVKLKGITQLLEVVSIDWH